MKLHILIFSDDIPIILEIKGINGIVDYLSNLANQTIHLQYIFSVPSVRFHGHAYVESYPHLQTHITLEEASHAVRQPFCGQTCKCFKTHWN